MPLISRLGQMNSELEREMKCNTECTVSQRCFMEIPCSGTSRICLQLRRQLSSSEDAASICRFQEFRRRVAGDCGGLFDLVEFQGCLAIERSSNGYRPLKRIGDSCTRDILLNSTLLSQESAPNRLIILLVHSALRDRDQGEDNCTSITTLLF